MEEKKCIFIQLGYDNGEVWEASGKDAEEILKHWQGGEVMAHLHGARYTGPTLKKVSGPRAGSQS